MQEKTRLLTVNSFTCCDYCITIFFFSSSLCVLCSAHHPRCSSQLLHGRLAQPTLLSRPELQRGAASLPVLPSRQVSGSYGYILLHIILQMPSYAKPNFPIVPQQKAQNRKHGREHGHQPDRTWLLLITQLTSQQSSKLARQRWRWFICFFIWPPLFIYVRFVRLGYTSSVTPSVTFTQPFRIKSSLGHS